MHKFFGTHIIGEFYEIQKNVLDDVEFFETVICKAINKAGFTCVGIQHKKFEPQGLTIAFLLSESHITIHTYPENKSLFFDVFTCGDSDPGIIAKELSKELDSKHENIRVIERGISKN